MTITPLDGEPIWCTDTDELWMGDGITLGGIPVAGVRHTTTLVLAEGIRGADGDLLYVESLTTIYRYVALGAAYTDDNTYVLSTGDGGNTRWVGIAGQYIKFDDIFVFGTQNNRGDNTEIAVSAQLLTNGNFATNDFTGWTAGANWSAATGSAVHTPGAVATLLQNPGIAIGQWIVVKFDIGRIAGSLNVSVGGVGLSTAITFSAINFSFLVYTTAAAGLVFTPSNDFNGSVDNITMYRLTPSDPVRTIRHDNDAVSFEERSGGATFDSMFLGANAGVNNNAGNNLGIGPNALRSSYANINNIAIGSDALRRISEVGCSDNTSVGQYSSPRLYVGKENAIYGAWALNTAMLARYCTIIGCHAGHSVMNADGNTFIGHSAGYSDVIGYNNTIIGYSAGYNVLGDANVMVGYQAGMAETGSNKLYISNSSTTYPLVGGDFAVRTIDLNGNVAGVSDSFYVYNNTGGPLAQYAVLRAVGNYNVPGPAFDIPLVNVISTYLQKPLGILIAALPNTTIGRLWKRGALAVTGFSTLASSVGAKVYATSAGVLTLTKTKYEVGLVLTLAANGVVYFNFGGAGSGAIDTYDTVAAAEAMAGTDNDLCYVVETDTFYRYEATAGTYVDDNTFVLSTADGGTTRWLGVAGKYVVDNTFVRGAIALGVRTITAGVTNLDATYNTILCNGSGGAITVNLPTAVGIAGRLFRFKVIDATASTTLDGNGGETIDGSLTRVLSNARDICEIQSDGANWVVTNKDTLPSPAGTPLFTLLGALTIDGAINLINTNIGLYTVPGGSSALGCQVKICNRNSSAAAIRLAHVDGAIGAVASEDYIAYNLTLLPYETKTFEIPGMAAADTILVRSDIVDVTFRIDGTAYATVEALKRVGAYNIAVVNTNETALLTTSNLNNIKFYVCNKDGTNPCSYRAALIDSNILANLAPEDYIVYEDTLSATETKAFELGQGLLTAQIFMLRATDTDVNVVIYAEEY